MTEPAPGSGDQVSESGVSPCLAVEAAEVRRLVCAVRNGDQEAYAGIVDRYQKRVFGLALVVVRDRAAAEDVTQEAFVRAYTELARYDEQREFYPWLATITVRLAGNWRRGQARAAVREQTAFAENTDTGDTADSLSNLIADESGRHLWESVATLPRGERSAVLLYYRHEMKLDEIASVLDVSSGTIKTLLFRARKRLRACMRDGNPEQAKQMEK